MSYNIELLFMRLFVLCLAGAYVNIMQSSTTWHTAMARCTAQNARLANITEVESNDKCNSLFPGKKKNTYWVGNFYKLSSRISIEGCYDIQNSRTEVGYKLLHDCFELCAGRVNKSGFFAHKAVIQAHNCICDLQVNSTNRKNECPNPLTFWWVYKVDLNDSYTGNKTCHQLKCTDSQVEYNDLRNIICGQYPRTNNAELRSRIPEEKLPYICESNTATTTSANETISEGYFRFGLNASVKSDYMEKQAVAFKCKAVSCSSYHIINTSLQNCSKSKSGFFCVTDNSYESRNSSSTIYILSPTPSTVSKSLSASPTTSTVSKSLSTSHKEHHYHESTSSYITASKITTQSNSQQRTSDAAYKSSLGNAHNSLVVITSPAQTSIEENSKSPRLNITPSIISRSSYTSSYATDLSEMNILESTTSISDRPLDGYSRIGLIVGSAVATVVIIVAAVLLVSCRLRRRGPFREKRFVDDIQINELNDSNTPTFDVHNIIYDMHTTSGDSTKFGLIDVPPDNSANTQNNEYAVVVKENQFGNQVIEQNCDKNGENSDDLMESEYDRLNHMRPRSGKESSNIYDSALGFREECDATYNTTVYRGIDKGDNSVYDHT